MNEYLLLLNDIENIIFSENESLTYHSTMKVGGTAKLAAFPTKTDAFCKLVRRLRKNDIKYCVVGNGSNVIFPDGEYDGVVVFTKNMKNISFDGDAVVAECGVNLIYLSSCCAEKSLSGAEFLCGIPGTVGGAVYMNAGAYGGSMSGIVEKSTCFSVDGGTFELDKRGHGFGYRTSCFKNSNSLLLSTVLRLKKADKEDIRAAMRSYKEKRSNSQPTGAFSAGSVFLPVNDIPAWKYIDEAGLRGAAIGGAKISEKHAGFIINGGAATSADVKALVEKVKSEVYSKTGVLLQTEIIFID